MNRAEKEKAVKQLNEKFSDVSFVSLLDYKGLNVSEISSLRHELRSAHTEFRVIKNSLARRAIKGTTLEVLDEHFAGPLAIALSSHDPVAPAKILVRFSKDNPKLEFKAGLLDGKPISRQNITELSRLPGKEVLLAILLGTLKSPPTGLVNVLSGILRKFIWTIQAIEKKKAENNES